MPEIRPSIYVPQPVNQELQLPIAFPPLPRVMVERFGKDAQAYEESLQTFWTRTRRVLADLRFDVTAPVNKAVKDTKSVVEHMEEFDEGLIIVSDGIKLGAAAILIEMELREEADDNLSGMYTLRVTAGSVVTGMKVTSADGPYPGDEISEIIFQTNVLKVQTATGPVITLLHVATSGIVFGADVSSDTFVSGPTGTGWRLGRNTGILECNNGLFRGAIYADSGLIGGFTIGPTDLYAGSGPTTVKLSTVMTAGLTVGNPTGLRSVHRAGTGGTSASFYVFNASNALVAALEAQTTHEGGRLLLSNTSGSKLIDIDIDSFWPMPSITFNGDTKLYRDAANVLKTDGAFTAQSFNATSSIRYKENLRPLGGALDLVEQLQAFRFDWKDGRAADDIGLIAEEVGTVFPTFVGRDSKSRIDSLDYSKLTAVLVEAVKELAKRVDGLEHQSQRG